MNGSRKRRLESVFAALTCLVLASLGVYASEEQSAAKQVYSVITPMDAPVVRMIPDVGKGIVIPGSYGQWGFVRWDVKPEVPPGTVTLRVLYYTDPDCTARTLLYVEDTEGTQLPMYGLQVPPGDDKSVHKLSFTVSSAKGVRAIVLKRGDAGEVRTVPIMGIELSHQSPQPDPRIRAYKELLARPAPFDLSRGLPRQWIEEAGKAALAMDTQKAGELTAQAEKWLAAESHYAWLADQVEYLASAAAVLKTQEKQALALTGSLDHAQRLLRWGHEDAGTALNRMDSYVDILDRAIGRGTSILPQKQPVIATWNRNWTLAGFAEEPTPLAIKWPGGVTLSLTENSIPDTIVSGGVSVKSRGEYAKGFTVRRSWTGCVWDSADYRFTASVLSPILVIDSKAKKVSFSVAGMGRSVAEIHDQRSGKPVDTSSHPNPPLKSVGNSQALVYAGEKGGVLIIPAGKALQLQGLKRGYNITCEPGGSVAVIGLPASWKSDTSKNANAARAAAISFWCAVAASPPAQCVQTYDGKTVALRYLYGNRAHPSSVRPVKIAPIPPLALAAQHWDTGLRNTSHSAAQWRGDSFSWGEGNTLTYNLPPTKSPNLRGINIGLATATEAKLKELADLGATSIRLLVMKDEVGTKLAERLKWVKQAGLKATIDQHFGAYYDPTPQDQAKLIELWEKIARVCQPDRDAIKAYDLKNEPMEDAKIYLPWAQKCVDAIRKIDPVTPILVEAPNMANPNGFTGMKPLKGNNLIYGVHVYVPHGFTHGRIYGTPLFGSPDNSPARFYPGWITPIDWSKSSETWFNGGFEWWDRWELQATCLPVYEFLIKNRLPLDVGEFGVVGYLMRDITIPTSQMWLKDAIDLFETWGASWDVWSYEYGYTWYPGGKELMAEKWKELNSRK